MSDTIPNSESLKILIIGDSSVGKTCIFSRYSEGTFSPKHVTTMGIDYFASEKIMEDGKKMNVFLWDTAGQERFRTITKNYFKGAHGLLLVYDVTNRKSFENVDSWVKNIKEAARQEIKYVLVGNKIDLPNRAVTTEEGQNLAKQMGVQFYETSAATSEGIEKVINDVIKMSYETYKFLNVSETNKKLENANKRKMCCH